VRALARIDRRSSSFALNPSFSNKCLDHFTSDGIGLSDDPSLRDRLVLEQGSRTCLVLVVRQRGVSALLQRRRLYGVRIASTSAYDASGNIPADCGKIRLHRDVAPRKPAPGCTIDTSSAARRLL
jgi:hypothetical protein